jgi:hypothetical protein
MATAIISNGALSLPVSASLLAAKLRIVSELDVSVTIRSNGQAIDRTGCSVEQMPAVDADALAELITVPALRSAAVTT